MCTCVCTYVLVIIKEKAVNLGGNGKNKRGVAGGGRGMVDVDTVFVYKVLQKI